MAVYIGHDECQVIYVAKNGLQRRVSSIWVGDQQVFPPANRQEIHVFTRDTQGYGRTDNGTYFGFTVPVPWWATSADVVIIGPGEKGQDGTKSFSGGSDGAGGKSGAWVVKTIALTEATEALVAVSKGTSTSPARTVVALFGVDGQATVTVNDGDETRTPNSGSTGGSVNPRLRTEYGQQHAGGAGGTRNNPGQHPGGGGGGGQGSNLLGNPTTGRDGGDGYVWLRFRSAPALDPGDDEFILMVGVSSGAANAPLRAWAVGIGKTHQTITEITVPMGVSGPSLQSLFRDCQALTSVPALDTSQVTNMDYMFYNCHALTTIPELNTSQVTNMAGMFYNCSSLTTIPAMDTSQVTNMYTMFYGCHALTTIPELNTSQVTDTRFMFAYCSTLTTIPELDTSQITSTRSMFYGCHALTTIPELDTSQVTDMSYMFYNCSSLESVPAMDTSQVTNMESMFAYCSSLTTIPELDTSQVTNTRSMFYGCHALTTIPALDTSQVTNMESMFAYCSTLTTIPELDTSQVTNMESMFAYCSTLTTIPELDTSQVTNMQSMFYNCSTLTTIPELDTSQVTTMYTMFYSCPSLTSVPGLDSHQVTDIYNTFYDCSSLESVTLPGMGNGFTNNQLLDMTDTKLDAAAANALMQSLGTPAPGGTLQLPSTATGADTTIAASKNWTVTISVVLRVGVTSGVAYGPLREWAVGIGKTYETITEITVPMEVIGPSLYSLFDGCSSLASVPDLDTSQVTNMGYMFNGCSSLASVPDLDTSQVTNMNSMFYGCSSLTAIPYLDTSRVTDMGYMFRNCSALTTVPDMDTSQVTNMYRMFYLCSSLESVTLPGMGNGFTAKQTLDMKATKLNAAAANALMHSLGTPPPGGTLQLPATAAGADTSIAAAKNWTVTTG